MRQTSRAVALLLALEGTQATLSAGANPVVIGTGFQDYTAAWSPLATDSATPEAALSSRTAGYAYAAAGTPNTLHMLTAVVQKAVILHTSSSETEAANANTPGSGCAQCIGGGAVWCSRTFSFLNQIATASTPKFQFEEASGADAMNQHIATTDILLQYGTYDGGSCCALANDFVAAMGKIGATGGIPTTGDWNVAVSTSTQPASSYNSHTCAALKNASGVYNSAGSTAVGFAQTAWEDSTTAWTSWWCSNGLYKYVADAGTSIVNNYTQGWQLGNNQRRELALVGCPQKAANCGIVQSSAGRITGSAALGTTAVTYNVEATLTGMSMLEKCTWVAWSYDYAPTWTITSGVAADVAASITATTTANSLGLTTDNWVIHAMEYTSTGNTQFDARYGSLLENRNTLGEIKDTNTPALSLGTYLPTVTMPAAQFATLRTWYGNGATAASGALTGMQGNWYAPGRNSYQGTASTTALLTSDSRATADALVAAVAGQAWGNVSNFPSSGSSTVATGVAAGSTAGSTANYGTVSASTTKFDMRVVRYLPASAAVTVWNAGSALQAQYTSAKSGYETAKTTWDAYVAILSKNAKMDAFAAAFSPPKAPTVPPLPNLPWLPNAYSGYVKMTNAEYASFVSNSGAALVSGAQPTAQQFWTSLDAAQTIGGWGSWTAQLFTYRKGWGKSFGTIGYSGATGTAASGSLSAVWRYQWTCRTTGSPPTQGPDEVCDKSYTPATTSTLPADTTAAATTANDAMAVSSGQARLVSVVSLWSEGTGLNTGTSADAAWQTVNWNAHQSFVLTWTGAEWSKALVGLKAITAPTAATAASSLTGIAGAQALAASAAAALAAAALY